MKFSSFVGFVVLIFISPLSSFLSAAGYAYLWSLTLASQYGPGPSYQSWYGIAIISSLLLSALARKDTEKDESPIATVFVKMFAFFLVMGFTILMALLTRAMLGWQ